MQAHYLATVVHLLFYSYTILLFVRIVLSWFPQWHHQTWVRFIGYYTDPFLNIFRRVLPPLGNDFIACLKDSSLVSVVAVNELTQMGRLRTASTFRAMETYNMVAFLYLSMTLLLSTLVRWLENKMKIEE